MGVEGRLSTRWMSSSTSSPWGGGVMVLNISSRPVSSLWVYKQRRRVGGEVPPVFDSSLGI